MKTLDSLRTEIDDLTAHRHGQPWRNTLRTFADVALLPMQAMIALLKWVTT